MPEIGELYVRFYKELLSIKDKAREIEGKPRGAVNPGLRYATPMRG